MLPPNHRKGSRQFRLSVLGEIEEDALDLDVEDSETEDDGNSTRVMPFLAHDSMSTTGVTLGSVDPEEAAKLKAAYYNSPQMRQFREASLTNLFDKVAAINHNPDPNIFDINTVRRNKERKERRDDREKRLRKIFKCFLILVMLAGAGFATYYFVFLEEEDELEIEFNYSSLYYYYEEN
eukprot:maker-scaffold_4-snap-gene-11.3-mRNA-1 protein AED:0.22 eAED:0.22 QI:165/1/1/1/1/1/2/730/178